MKKLACILIFIALSLGCAFCVTACSGCDEHKHTFGEWTVTTAATCTQEGVRSRKCSECGFEETESVAKTQHAWEKTGTVAATCTEDGRDLYECSVCHTEKSETITKLGHDFGAWTFTQDNQHYRTCKRDGCDYVDGDLCTFTEVVVDPTCSEGGYIKHVCECGNSYTTDQTPPTVHTWGEYTHTELNGVHKHSRTCSVCGAVDDAVLCEFSDTTTDATCAENGKITHTCVHCGYEYSEEGAEKQPHTFTDGWVYAGKDEQDQPYHHRVCTVCGYDDKQLCVMTDSETAQTCPPSATRIEYCSICKHSDDVDEGVSLDHTYGEEYEKIEEGGVYYHTKTCTVCGYVLKERCVFGTVTTDPTCLENGKLKHTCLYCGQSYEEDGAPASGHIWNDWKIDSDHTTHTHDCAVCGYEETGNCSIRVFSVTEPTCENPGYTLYRCDECGDSYQADEIPAKGHNYSQTPTRSFEDGGKHYHAYACTHDSSHEKIEECTKTNPHKVEPTCYLPGYTEYYCDICHTTYQSDPVAATNDHNWGSWAKNGNSLISSSHYRTCQNEGCKAIDISPCKITVTNEKATCTTNGYAVYKCSECGFERRIHTQNSLGHDFGTPVHFEEDGVDKHKKTCKRKECGFEEIGNCVFVDSSQAPTCSLEGHDSSVCLVCLYSESTPVDKLAHQWSPYTYTSDGHHSHFCTVCHTVEEETCNYNILNTVDATCTADGYEERECIECKNKDKNITKTALGHSWVKDESTEDSHRAHCANCDERHDSAHDFSESNICSVCKYDGIVYKLDSTGTYYIAWHGRNVRNAKTIVIPEMHDNVPVKEIASRYDYVDGNFTAGFADNISVRKLYLPESLEVIGQGAFSGCILLQEVHILFEDYGAEPHLTTIMDNAFDGCRSLVSAHNLPSTLKTIGQYAFRGCTSLTDIVLPEGLESIGREAFANTAYFKDKTNWSNNGLYISGHLIKAESDINGTYQITPGTKTVGVEAFMNCVQLTEIDIPASVVHFDSDAFYGCTGLQRILFQGDFHTWMDIVFVNDFSNPLSYATSLTIAEAHDEIIVPEGKTTIPAGTFRNTSITKISLPSTITYIGAEAFLGCTQLATIELAGGTCINNIGKDAFKDSLYYNTPENWIDNVLYLKDKDDAVYYALASKAELTGTATILEKTLTLADSIFAGNMELTSVVTPSSIMKIGKNAFDGCRRLASVVIGENCLKIGEYAFRNCESLTSAEFKNCDNWLYSTVLPAYRGIEPEKLADNAEAARVLKTSITLGKMGHLNH